MNFLISFVVTRIIYKIIGFHYDIQEGLFNIKFLIDLGLWIIIYNLIGFLRKKIKSKTEKR